MISQKIKWKYKRVINSLDKRERIHFLHIGKNAGTQIGLIASQVNKNSNSIRIVTHGHGTRLSDLPKGEKYFFSVRNPEKRFLSGFYSRKRKGMPRIYVEWTQHENAAFEKFEHANELAEALFDNSKRGRDALCAMKSILHCSMEQINWFDQSGFFLEVNPPAGIIRQENFKADLDKLFKEIGFQSPVEVTNDPVKSHKNDYTSIPPLSERAKKNLFEWYRQDFEFYNICANWLDGGK